MSLPYSFISALQSLWREKWINILSMFTVASSLLIITLTAFTLYNIELLTRNLPERFSIIAYLKDNLSREETEGIISSLKKREDIAELRYISREEALKEIKNALKEAGRILEGLDENPLSPSIEIKLKRDFVTPFSAIQISEDIKKMPGIDDVLSGEKFAEDIYTVKNSVRNIGMIIFLTLSVGVVFVTYSTIKILFYRRKEEIETIKLLGASRGFIRAPFVIEGGIIGLFGGAVGTLLIAVFYFGIAYKLTEFIPAIKAVVLPVEFLIVPPIIGLLLGIIGSVIAIGRLRL